jgi:hypothetical protein
MKTQSHALHESGIGPTLPTWASQPVGSYLRHTGRGADVVAEAAFDPNPTSRQRAVSRRPVRSVSIESAPGAG